jgi:hypothetical protein
MKEERSLKRADDIITREALVTYPNNSALLPKRGLR